MTSPPRIKYERRHRIHAKRLALFCLALLLGGEFILVAMTSPWFLVHKIEVKGASKTTREQVMQVVATAKNTNLFRLKPRPLVELLQRNPLIRKATIHKAPPGTLIVQVTERAADLVLRTDGKCYLVDSSNVPFKTVDNPPSGLTLITCDLPGKVTLGHSINSAQFRSARKCLDLARKKKNFAASEISVDRNGDLCLNTCDGLEVRLGQPVQLADKLEKVEQAIAQIPVIRKDAEYIDVTCPQEPAFKPKRTY